MPDTDVAPPSIPPLTGKLVLGRYRIVRPLAKGGMGVVYLGRVEGAAGFAKPVVIKSVASSLDGGAEGEQLFAREARIVSNLQHPNIVAVIDFGKIDATYVMVLEYVHGYNLGQWQRFVTRTRGRVAVPHAVHAVLSVLDALEFAHELERPDGSSFGIVHRDVSPGNVLIDVQGHVKLGDFGIARSEDDEFRTECGTFRGTLGFSAPEALDGAGTGPALDQYAAAVVLYQLLAGKNPFRQEQLAATISRVLNFVPPELSSIRDDVPKAIEAAITRAMAKNPAQRFASVSEFAQALLAGAPWSEREAADSFAAQIRADFAGSELADVLKLESLAVRDASWREAQASSRAPVALSSSPPALEAAPLPVIVPTVGGGDVAHSPGPVAAPAAAPEPANSRLAFAVVALGAVIACVILLLSRRPPHLLVVEKQEGTQAAAVAEPEPAAPTTPESALATTTSAPSAAPSAKAAPRRGPSTTTPPADRGTLLARAFQRREPQIQGCFQRHAPDVDARAGISVRFQIDSEGNVQRAQIVPSSVAASPLGSCLAAIAQSTAFGPQPEGLSFAIPISARVVRAK